jgi:hypothetical protein
VQSRDESEIVLTEVVNESTKSFLRQVLDAVLAAIRAGRTEDAQPVLALGVMLGWWTAAVGDRVVESIKESWQAAYGVTLTTGSVVTARADAMAFHIAAVRDRLSRSALPEIPEKAFDNVRLSQSSAALGGWGIEQQARDIAERLAWEPNKDYWKQQKAYAENEIDKILDPLGKPGSPARTYAHKHDPKVKIWQEVRATAVDKINEDRGDWEVRAERIARTEATSAWNSGALAALAAEGRTHKEWVAHVKGRNSDRTRDSHRAADGQVVPISRPFRVGESVLMMPGDPAAPPWETVNCRCTVVGADEPAAPALTAAAHETMDQTLRRKADPMPDTKALHVRRMAWAVRHGGTFAIGDASWVDQLRVPRGNGDRSGRWTYTPWMHMDDLLSAIPGLDMEGRDDSAYHDVSPMLDAADEALRNVDREGFDPKDPAAKAAFVEAADRLDEALDGLSGDAPDLADRIKDAATAIREFADTDWSLMEEAADIGRDDSTAGDGAGRRASPGMWVWNEDLPSDDPINDPRTSKELQDRLAEIRGHHTAPSPKMRRDRAAAMQELNDRKARDNGVMPLADDDDWTDEPSDITRDEPTTGIATVTKTPKGYKIEFPGKGGRVANIGPDYTHVALYSTGGWNPETQKNDLPTFSKHKSLAGLNKTARDHVGYSGGTFEVVDLSTIGGDAPDEPLKPRITGMSDVILKDKDGNEVWAGDMVTVGGSGNEWEVNHINPDGTLTLQQPGRGLEDASDRTLNKYNVDPATVTLQRHVYERPVPPVKGERVGEPIKILIANGGHELHERISRGDGTTIDRVIVSVRREDGVWGVYPPTSQSPALFQTGSKAEAARWADEYAAGQHRDEPAPGPDRPDLSVTADQLEAARDRFRDKAAEDGLITAIRERRWDDALHRASLMQGGESEAALKALQKIMERVAVAKRNDPGESEPEPDPLRHKEQDFIDDAKARDASYDLYKHGVKQPGGPWKVSHGSRNGYIHIVNAQGIDLDVDRSELVEQDSGMDALDAERDARFKAAFTALAEAWTNRVNRTDAFKAISVMALNERAGRTKDVLPDAAWRALQNTVTASKMGDDNFAEAVTDLREALQGERVPPRWRMLADYLTVEKPLQDSKEAKNLRESKAAHKVYQNALRDVPVEDGRVARPKIKNLLANLRGQTSEDLHLGVLTEDQTEAIDAALARMWESVGKPSRTEYDTDVIALRNAVRNLPDGNPWHDTVWTLHDLNQSAWRPTDIWNPPMPPRLDSTLDEILDEKHPLGPTGIAIGMEDLWKMSEQENQDYINEAIGAPSYYLTAGLKDAIIAMRTKDLDAWSRAMALLLSQTRGRNDHWGKATDRLELIDALGQKVLQSEAGKVEQDLRERYGTLPDERTTREAVIADVGQFYYTRAVNNNCVLASQAYELRRRGIDVHPKQAKKGRNSTATQRAWFNTGYPFETYVDGLKGRRAKGRYETIVKHAKDNYEPGQRGTIRAGWKGRSFGHIWNWEVLEDGSVVFLDAQTGEIIDGSREDYWGEMDWRFVTFARLDHLTLKEDIEVMIVPKEDVEKITPELLAFAKELQALAAKRIQVLLALNATYKSIGSVSYWDPKYAEVQGRRDEARAPYAAINETYQEMLKSPQAQELKEIGNSFPFLDPNTYRK